MSDLLLEKIDLIRERMHVSYKEARQALEQAEGSVVEALVILESDRENRFAEQKAFVEQRQSEFVVLSSELIDRIKELIKQGQATVVRVLHNEQVLLELPLVAGAATVLLLPQLALIAGIAALFAKVTLQIEYPTKAECCKDECICEKECHCEETEETKCENGKIECSKDECCEETEDCKEDECCKEDDEACAKTEELCCEPVEEDKPE